MSWEVAIVLGLCVVAFLLIYLSTILKQGGTLINAMKILLISIAIFLLVLMVTLLPTIIDSESTIPAAQVTVLKDNLASSYDLMIYAVVIPFILFIILYLLYSLVTSLRNTAKESARGRRL